MFISRTDAAVIARKKPRICMLTARGFALNAFRCGFYEGQDVLSGVDDVDLIFLRPKPYYHIRQPLQKYLVWHDYSKKAVSVNMLFEPVKLTRDYELFIAYFPHIQDLIQLSAVKGWKEHCEKSICWIDEVYAADVPAYKTWLSVLKDFDHIAIGMSGTVNAFSREYERPCHFVPGAVDTLRFSAYPAPPARVIDIYSIGRIGENLHHTFLDMAARKGMFYVHDTFLASDTRVYDHKEHRQMLANMAKRSRFFHVAPAKMNAPEETRGQIEIGFRYYEGSAAGAVMIGQAPDCESFHTMFDWPDAVIEIQPDGSDIQGVLSDLAAQEGRLSAISRRNTAEALLRHDWVYRWKRIFDIVGLSPTDEMKLREDRLKQKAEQIGNGE
jgi:hypothetical protein